jgi:hypothetical protein
MRIDNEVNNITIISIGRRRKEAENLGIAKLSYETIIWPHLKCSMLHNQDLRTGTISSGGKCHLPLHMAF